MGTGREDKALPSTGQGLQVLNFPAAVRLKAELQRDPPTTCTGPHAKQQLSLGHEQVCLAASSAWRRGCKALNFLSSWDNQSIVFPQLLFSGGTRKALAKRLHVVSASSRDRSALGNLWFPSTTVGWERDGRPGSSECPRSSETGWLCSWEFEKTTL